MWCVSIYQIILKKMTAIKNKHRSVHTTPFKRMGDSDESRTFQFVISTEARDRHGTVIKADGWELDNFNANPIVAYMHQTDKSWWSDAPADPDHILGVGRAYIEDDQLIGEVTFEDAETNPLADKIMRKIMHGTLRATSVGFRHIEGHWGVVEDNEDSGTYYYDRAELLEFSIVNIPSNPEALMRSYESELLKMLPAHPDRKEEQNITGDNRADLVRESQIFLNKKFIESCQR
jgi:HK97 family phage prohead protease